ncbi:MAG: DNA primase [Flavobacteriales bacterium]|nr:DNA primase [Flavobacteriales bacterium]
MKISKDTIEEIFNTAIIEEVISEFVKLKKTGANYKGLSPFNDEKTPSFVVSPSKEIWKDFSSGKGGNVISFLMEHEQYTYPESLLFLAKKYNIEVKYIEQDTKLQEKENERQAAILVLNFVKNIFAKNLFNKDTLALQYLNSRGFSNSIIQEFEVGYCSKRDSSLMDQTRKSQYNTKYLLKMRLINEKGHNRFAGRIMFPIHGMTGEVLGFGGRVLEDKKKSVKYLNSDSSDLYQKSKILYGMHLAKNHIKKLDFCYVVEGYTDVMALFQIGIKNVVSSCGTALTRDQIRLIHRFTDTIIILFDSDQAGINATMKAIDLILKEGMKPKILQLPSNEDPASFMTSHNTEKINVYFQENTLDFIDFKKKLTKSNEAEDLIDTTNSIIKSISLIQDAIAQTFYLRQASKKLELKEVDLQNSLQTYLAESNFKNKKKPIVSESDIEFNILSVQKKHAEEIQLIRLLINYGSFTNILVNNTSISIAEFIIRELQKDSKYLHLDFSFALFNQIFQDIIDRINNNQTFSADDFINHDNEQFRLVSAALIGETHLLGSWSEKDIIVVQEQDILYKVTKESILRFKLKRIQSRIQYLLIKLKQDESDDVVREFSQLSKVEKKIQQNLGRIV